MAITENSKTVKNTRAFRIIEALIALDNFLNLKFNLIMNSKENGILKANDFKILTVNNLKPEFE
ncbi:hypothetical protein [Chryseobacterium sp. Leaf394]|uniref:hypothetical protein n=1 Tax=Chryseobacterium sp. Leaf394 TaxID=1736361 RepID=UPI000FF8AAB7|nr:hypothetical protein [Chryseobacterium sp. Leaf394]